MNLHPLVDRLAQLPGSCAVTQQGLAPFLSQGGEQVLFFSGDPVRFPEGLDVAVVLPELRAAFQGRFQIGVVPRDDETALARCFGVVHWPSLVFLREGQYLGCVSGMKDWDDYLQAVSAVRAAQPSRPPSVGIAVVSADASSSSCH